MSVRSSRSAWASGEPVSTFTSKANRAGREGEGLWELETGFQGNGLSMRMFLQLTLSIYTQKSENKGDHVYVARQPHSKVKPSRLALVFWLLASFYKKRSDFIFHSILPHNYNWIMSRIWDVLKPRVHKIYSIFL